jgi:3-dehydroquinate synthetase
VGIGMRMAAELGRRLGVLEDGALARRQDALLARFGLPTTHRVDGIAAAARRLTGHCALDKKVAAGRTRFVVPIAVGRVGMRTVEDAGAVEAAFACALSA